MDGSTIIAIVGLVTTAGVGLGVPVVQGRIAARNTASGRLHEQRVAVYADAMAYIRWVETRLDETLEDPDLRSRHAGPDVPHEDLVTARLRLVAPTGVLAPWEELIHAWRALSWNAEQDGPVNDRGVYQVRADDPAAIRVQAATRSLVATLRQAMAVGD